MSDFSNIPKLNLLTSTNEKQKRPDLGPRWSEDELDIFLKYFRKSNLEEVDKMQEELQKAGYRRTADNLRAVFFKNKNFLTYNASCTSKDLVAIMADHYETMEAEHQLLADRNPIRTREPVSESALEKRKNMSHYTSKGGEFLDEPTRQRPYEDSINQKRKAARPQKSQHSSDESDSYQYYKPKKLHVYSSVYPTERFKKSARKINGTKGKFPLDFDFNDPELLKNAEIWSRTCLGKSNKRVGNFSLRRNVNERYYPTSFLKLLDNETFYSTLDEPFFAFNQFQLLLGSQMEDKNLTKGEWNVLRRMMGKPRRFSQEFIKSQIQDLNNYRVIARNYMAGRGTLPENRIHPFMAQRIRNLKPLQVSQIVLAVHPQCNHIHAGSILTISGSSVIIKFFPTDLGAVSVSDTKIRRISPEEATQIMDYFSGSNLRLTGIPMNRNLGDHDGDKSVVQNRLIQDLDFNALALFIKILERKTALVAELRNFNDMAENEPLERRTELFGQEYGWTGVQIKLLDNALKHIVTKTRLRGLSNYDIEQISNNLDQLMTNPLKALAELEQKGNEDIDPKVIQEIKQLLNKNIEEKISEQLKGLTDKYANLELSSQKSEHKSMEETTENPEQNQEQNGDIPAVEPVKEEKKPLSDQARVLKERVVEDLDEDKQKDLKKMVDNMVGVILSLKLSGDLNMTENRYLTDLHHHIFEENSEEFHEINTVLLNICSK